MDSQHSASVRLFLYLLVVLICLSAPAISQNSSSAAIAVPNVIRFSSVLLDGDGHPHNGAVGVTFALYKDSAGAAPLWIETQNVTTDDTGHYSVLLGDTKAEGIPLDLFTNGEARWLGVKAEGQDEQARVLLVSVPYALKAGDAETLGGRPASAFILNQSGNTSSTSTSSGGRFLASPVPVQASSGTVNFVGKFVNATDLGNSLIFDNGTKVGIGNTNPAATLDVSGDAIFRGFSATFATTSSFGPQFDFLNNASPTPAHWRFGVPGFANATSFFILDYVNQAAVVTMEKGAGANSLYLKAGGNVGFGTATPTSKVTVNGVVESKSGGFKFPDGSMQLSSGISQSLADTRYVSSSGGVVAGSISATSFNGNGANLTNLNVANLTGTLGSNQLGGTYLNPVNFNNSGNTFTGNGSALTNLNASNLNGIVNPGNLPNGIAYTGNSNNFGVMQSFNSGAQIFVNGAGNSGTALNVGNNDSQASTVNISNNGGGDFLTMNGNGNGGFRFHNDGYFEANGWAPSIGSDPVNSPITPGQVVKFTPAGIVVPTTTSDNTGAIGIAVQSFPATQFDGPQTETVLSGVANCTFDNTAVVGDYVSISGTTAGLCHDAGPNLPNVGQVLGRVVEVKPGKNQVYLAGGTEFRVSPFFVKKLKLFNQTAAISSTTLFTVGLSGTYRISVYIDSGNTASGTITANLGWTDDVAAHSAVVGTVTSVQQFDSKTTVIRALSGASVGFSTQFAGVSGTPSYNVVYIVELLETD